eukprot:m.232581 g.232581  ORF g.232581 m.232581 type:complete len:511 (-) comp16021_c0_seq4:237-1769(-)
MATLSKLPSYQQPFERGLGPQKTKTSKGKGPFRDAYWETPLTPPRMGSSKSLRTPRLSPPQAPQKQETADFKEVANLVDIVLEITQRSNLERFISAQRLLLTLECQQAKNVLFAGGSRLARLAQLLVRDPATAQVIAECFAKLTTDKSGFEVFPEFATISVCTIWSRMKQDDKPNYELIATLLQCLLNLSDGSEYTCDLLNGCPLTIPVLTLLLESQSTSIVSLAATLAHTLTKEHGLIAAPSMPAWSHHRCCSMRIPALLINIAQVMQARSYDLRKKALQTLVNLAYCANCDPKILKVERDEWIKVQIIANFEKGTMDILGERTLDVLTRKIKCSTCWEKGEIISVDADTWMLEENKNALEMHAATTHHWVTSSLQKDYMASKVQNLVKQASKLAVEASEVLHEPNTENFVTEHCTAEDAGFVSLESETETSHDESTIQSTLFHQNTVKSGVDDSGIESSKETSLLPIDGEPEPSKRVELPQKQRVFASPPRNKGKYNPSTPPRHVRPK